MRSVEFEGYMIQFDPKEYYVDFRVVSIVGKDADGGHILYKNENEQFVDEPSKAEQYLHGSVKWDGCSNLWFDDHSKNVMLHFCDLEDAAGIGRLFAELYRIAYEEMKDSTIVDERVFKEKTK